MRKAWLATLLFLVNFLVFAQIENPVEWKFKSKDLGNGEYELRFIPKIEKGWYIYSQHIADGGPVPTSFTFEPTADYKVVGEIEEPKKKIEGFDEFFKMDVVKFKRGMFKATIKSDKEDFIVKGDLEFMTCNDSKCLPPEKVPFEFILGKAENIANNNAANGILEPVKWSYELVPTNESDVFEMVWTAKIDDGWYLYSQIDAHPDAVSKPQPTKFQFEQNNSVKYLEDHVREEGNLKDVFDKVFELQIKKFSKEAIFKRKVQLLEPNAVIKGYVEFMTCDDSKCIFPEPIKFAFNGEVEAEEGLTQDDIVKGNKISSLIADCGNDIPKSESEDTKGKTPWMIFLLGFLGGLAALLTPCVFPMIPLTVSFFTKQSKDRVTGIRNAIIYAISIIVIYVTLGYLVTIIFGADALNAMSTDPWFNLAFFALFVIFAISFFGYYEITLPNWLINKSDQASDKGGLIGIFFMAFTLALVSFSCTGPIIGTLLVEAASTGATVGPVLGMFGFALALALPFALFAAFPGWLNSLPKSGGWLNTVKVTLGFIELIFAIKFLSNADLVRQWGLIKLETFYVIWIILFVAMGLYLLGFIRFRHDVKKPFKQLGFTRIGLGLLSIAFAIYLIPGIFCQDRALVSGFPPPKFYSYNCAGGHIHDLAEAQALAKKEGKPVFVDFTGWACVNCRKMEENVWPNSKVANLMEQYLIVSLYVDEDLPLQENEWFRYKQGNKIKTVKTVGNKWSFLQANCLQTNSQPYYVLLNDDAKLLNSPVGYTPDIDQYAEFLQEGLDNYKEGKVLIP